jgi:uncharacterized protein involved in type VI secretion and phage assembly
VNATMQGVYVGTVKSNSLDSEGRIEIVLDVVNGDAATYLARVATLMAGPQRGMQFLPEVDDQVLVAFEQGYFDRPIIIGSLWNSKDKPPDVNQNGNNDLKLIKTRGGNEIRLNDNNGAEKIEIVDKTGNNKITISTQDNSISLVADGAINIEGSSVAIKSTNGDITINSTQGNGKILLN